VVVVQFASLNGSGRLCALQWEGRAEAKKAAAPPHQ
jgi:hypothetical protein